MLSEKKEQKLINTNVITIHNPIAISRDQQRGDLVLASFKHVYNFC